MFYLMKDYGRDRAMGSFGEVPFFFLRFFPDFPGIQTQSKEAAQDASRHLPLGGSHDDVRVTAMVKLFLFLRLCLRLRLRVRLGAHGCPVHGVGGHA